MSSTSSRYHMLGGFMFQYLTARSVHQIMQTAKIASKLPVKWHNRTAPQVTMHRTHY